MICPLCLRSLASLGFIETMTTMLGMGMAPSIIGTNNAIPHTTEAGGARAATQNQS